MSSNRKTHWVAASMGVMTLASVASGAEGLRLETTTRTVPERGRVAGARMLDEGRKATFIVPPGWRMGASQEDKKVVLQAENYGATCEIRFHNRAGLKPGDETLMAEYFRDLVLASDARSRVLKEYVWPTSQGRAFAYETETKGEHGLKTRSRVLFLVRDTSMLEFHLTAKGDQFETFQKAFENLIASFREE